MMEAYFGYIALGIIYIISITIHEYAHAISAYRLGDDTPKIE
jgi:Zn-dependent protease